MKTISRKIVIALLLVSVVFGQLLLVPPKPAEAFLGIGDFNFSTQIGNIYDIFKDIAVAAAERVAINYSNKFLKKFVDKVVDKYRIKDFSAYEKVLSGYYINKYVYDNVADPDLRAIYGLLARDLNNRATVTDSKGQTQPVLAALKQKIDKIYYERGGIDSNRILNPNFGAWASDQEYFAAAQAYFANPPNFTEQQVYGEYGQIVASSQAAANQEISGSNGFKSDRSTPTGIVPHVCNGDLTNFVTDNGDEETPPFPITDQNTCEKFGGTWEVDKLGIAQSAIQNPSALIHNFATNGIQQIFTKTFGASPNNIWSTIGGFLGDYLFNQLNLNKDSGTFNEDGTKYDPGTGASQPMVTDVDIDGDNVPDGIDGDGDGKLLTPGVDSCYHGGTPPNCKKSSEVSTSPYFTPICTAVDRAVTGLTTYAKFMDDHADQMNGGNGLKGAIISKILGNPVGFVMGALFSGSVDNFNNDADAQIWSRRSDEAGSAIQEVLSSIQSYHSTYFDNMEISVSRYSYFMTQINESLVKDNDLDLKTGPGNGGGGLENLMKNTAYILRYLKEIKVQIGKCGDPNLQAVAAVPTPPIVQPGDEGTGACSIAPGSYGNDGGAPTSAPDIASVVFDQAPEAAGWSATSNLSQVSADPTNITLQYDKGGSWPGIDIGNGALAVANPWIMVWRGSKWHATTFSWMRPNQYSKEVGDVFCGGAGGSQTMNNFVPTAGETYMFMVSTIARDANYEAQQGVHERTQIVPYVWPSGIPNPGTGDNNPPPPGPTVDCNNTPGSMACNSTNHTDLVQKVKDYLISKNVSLSGNCGAFEITKRVAWALRGEGTGYLTTFHSGQCNGFASDVIAYTDSSQVDILNDGGGANGPQWGAAPPPTENGVHYAPPSDPGDPPGSY